jgi:hypothetical protein
MRNTPRGLDFFASLHLTILERPANFEFIEQSAMSLHGRCHASQLLYQTEFYCFILHARMCGRADESVVTYIFVFVVCVGWWAWSQAWL